MFTDLISSVTVFDGDLLRNIQGIREIQELFDDLGESEHDYTVAHIVSVNGVSETSGELLTRPFDYGVAIAYPFVQENWHQTRFSDGTRYGVWYGSLDLETTIFESVHHWRQFVIDSFPNESMIVADRRVFKALCNGILISLLGKEQISPAIVHPSDYSFTNAFGHYVWAQNQNGLLTKSARCDGTNAAIFTPDILSKLRDHCFLSYLFSPSDSKTVRVERTRGQQMMLID